MAILHKLVYRSPVKKYLTAFFCGNGKANFKIPVKFHGTQRAKTIAKLKDFLISKFIKTVWYCYKDKHTDQKYKMKV